MAGLEKYLRCKHRTWHIRVPVPRELHGRIKGRRSGKSIAVIEQSLGTKDEDAARRRIGPRVYAQIQQQFDSIRQAGVVGEAMRIGNLAPEEQIAAIFDTPMGNDARTIGQFVDIATGKAEPLKPHYESWLKDKKKVRAQTRQLYGQALKELFAHFGEAVTIPEITRKAAGRFIGAVLSTPSKGDRAVRSRATMRRLLSTYSTLWAWLERKGYVESNPWRNQPLPEEAEPEESEDNGGKRPYTEAELASLLSGPAADYHEVFPDLMRVALYTGARADEIASLQVRNVRDGVLHIKESGRRRKSESATRVVPVHHLIGPILERRCNGKPADAPVFPECRPQGKDKRPSKGLSQPFTRYRRAMDVPDGCDFHSFRRCFATAIKNAAASGNAAANEVVAGALMGHRAESLAFGRYGGPVERLDALRKGVEAVDFGPKITALT